jgi:hypothetical protein
MADPYANYLANIGPFAGPGLAPYGMTREQAALYGMPKAPEAMDPGLSYLGGGIAGQLGLESLQNMADLGQGIDPRYNSAGLDVGPKATQALGAVGNAAMRGMAFAPKGSAGVFGGQLTQDPEALSRLRKGMVMGLERETPERIYQETGTWAGPEGGMRYEIPDTGSSLTKAAEDYATRAGWSSKVIAPLGEILNHPAAYEAYPGLKGMMTEIGLNPINAGGWFMHGARPGQTQISSVARDFGGPQGIHGILLHEINHGIQGIEGFPQGFSTQGAVSHADDFIKKINKQISDLGSDHWMLKREKNPLDAPDMARIAAQIERLQQMRDDFRQSFNPYDYYRRAAGEVESRGVQRRMTMPQSDLNKVPPEFQMGLDVPVANRWIP